MTKFTALLLLVCLGCSQTPTEKLNNASFYKPEENPIIEADSSYTFHCPVKGETVQWQKADVFNPGAVVKDGKVYLFVRSEDNPKAELAGRTSRIGLAHSQDGIHFTKHPSPVLYPDSGRFMKYDYPGGCEDPRVVETDEGMYVMTYTSWNHDTARLSVAFSRDLYNWEKQGLAFAKAYEGRFINQWSKSGSIVTKMKNGRPVVAKINGKYWMYWGEYFINLAWSENLVDWTPLLNEKDELKVVVGPRDNKFDSHLAECGPPAIITEEGILLLYNGKNTTGEAADPNLPEGTYSVGKVIFDETKPEKVIYRSDTYILKPTLSHEITGQYEAGTTFAEGLVYFDSKWFIYYGTADSYVGVAVSE